MVWIWGPVLAVALAVLLGAAWLMWVVNDDDRTARLMQRIQARNDARDARRRGSR